MSLSSVTYCAKMTKRDTAVTLDLLNAPSVLFNLGQRATDQL